MKTLFKNAVLILIFPLMTTFETNAQEIDLAEPIRNQLTAPDKPFSNLIEITIIPGQEKVFERLFGPVIAEVRKEDGNIEFQLNRHPNEPNVYFLYERWANLKVLEDHMVTKHMSDFWPKYFPLLARIPDIKVFMVDDLQF